MQLALTIAPFDIRRNGALCFPSGLWFYFKKPVLYIWFLKLDGLWSYSPMFISGTWVQGKMQNALLWWGHPGSPRLSLQSLSEIGNWKCYLSFVQTSRVTSQHVFTSSCLPSSVHHHFILEAPAVQHFAAYKMLCKHSHMALTAALWSWLRR